MGQTKGIGAGIDVQKMVNELMDTQRKSLNRLDNQKAVLTHQKNQYRKLNQYLNEFDKKLSSLSPVFSQAHYKAQSSDESALVAISNNATQRPTQHSLHIQQLALAHQLASDPFSSQDESLNLDGEFTITFQQASMTVSISPNDSLEAIKDKINLTSMNPGVRANILSTTGAGGVPEYRLILTAMESGASNAISVDSTIQNLLFDHEITPAQNAKFTLDGFNVERASNSFSDVLEGITFTLLKANTDVHVAVRPDLENKQLQIKSGLHGLVEAYNNIVDLIDKNQSTSQLRDSTYNLVKMRLKSAMEGAVGNNSSVHKLLDVGIKLSGAVEALNDEGVDYVINGRLSIDESRLDEVLKSSMAEVTSFFASSETGFLDKTRTLLKNLGEDSGTVTNREQSISKQEKMLDGRIEREEDRLLRVRDNLIRQYSMLDVFMQRYKQMSDYLEQQFDAMSKMYGK